MNPVQRLVVLLVHIDGYLSCTVECISTARKGSLGQGNVFTPVSHCLHGGCIPACNGADTPKVDNPQADTLR